MEKTEFVVNFLREFIIGTDFEAIDGQLFKVLHKTCLEAESLIPEHERRVSKEIPSSGQELDRFLGLVDEFSKSHASFTASLSTVESLLQQKQSDIIMNKGEEVLSNKKPKISTLEESFSNIQ